MIYKIIQESSFNDETGVLKTEKVRTIPMLNPNNKAQFIYTTGRITESTFKYNLITYSPSKTQLKLQQGDKIKVKYNNIVTDVVISSANGRISGLSSIIKDNNFFNRFNIGNTIQMIYDPISHILELR